MTTLKCGADLTEMTQLCRIKSYPDLANTPEILEITDLQDDWEASTRGVEVSESLVFTCNYTPTAYSQAVRRISDSGQYYQVEFGRNGNEGVFYFQGTHVVRLISGEVNGVKEMEIIVIPSTNITQILSYSLVSAGRALLASSQTFILC